MFLITIFVNLLSKLYVRVLSVEVLVNIFDFVLVYNGKSVVNVAELFLVNPLQGVYGVLLILVSI